MSVTGVKFSLARRATQEHTQMGIPFEHTCPLYVLENGDVLECYTKNISLKPNYTLVM